MYQGLVHLHNVLRWVMLLLLVIAIVRHFGGMNGRKAFTPGDRKTGLFLMITAHVQLLLGLIQWFAGDWGLQILQTTAMGEIMKNPVLRFWTVEHSTRQKLRIF